MKEKIKHEIMHVTKIENLVSQIIKINFIYTFHMLISVNICYEESENEKLSICWNKYFQGNQYYYD